MSEYTDPLHMIESVFDNDCQACEEKMSRPLDTCRKCSLWYVRKKRMDVEE
ncbi:MAG: hypothetical protein GF411_03085 [Candidatus Lokiarchaeota archaeon]|nr:hypothetical protein [Candidatus Lokiarchaeota archaeon]